MKYDCNRPDKWSANPTEHRVLYRDLLEICSWWKSGNLHWKHTDSNEKELEIDERSLIWEELRQGLVSVQIQTNEINLATEKLLLCLPAHWSAENTQEENQEAGDVTRRCWESESQIDQIQNTAVRKCHNDESSITFVYMGKFHTQKNERSECRTKVKSRVSNSNP